MEQIVDLLQQYGLAGLFILSFCESVFSPILPDIMLIPMALAVPEQAIYYSLVATGASVLGGVVGFGVGHRFGPPLVKRYVSPQHSARIDALMERYGGWAVWIAAMAPIPYKFVCISAGAFRVHFGIFMLASFFGRAKRFLLEGVLIYFYGPTAVRLINEYSTTSLYIFGGLAVVLVAGYWLRSYLKRKHERCGE